MIKKRRLIPMFSILFFFWIILTERMSLESIIIGAIISLLVMKLNRKYIGYITQKKYFSIEKMGLFIKYLLLLVKEVVIANYQVAKIVLNPKYNINPQTIEIKTKVKDPFLKAILGNSITLTPGTITIQIHDNGFTVHCLTAKYVDGLINSKFEELLLRIEE